MNKPVIITADSTCDISEKLKEQLQIAVLPLTVMEGDQAFKDGVDITPARIYDDYRQKGQLPKTAAISPQEFTDFFTPLVEKGCEVVHLDISSKLSGSYQNACISAMELEGIYPIDTTHLSSGMALMLLEACRLRDEGRSAWEISEYLNAYREKVRTSFVVDTLEFIRKGGRCSGVTALGANLLHIKPCLEMHDGELKVGKKYRGAMRKVYAQYIRDKLTTDDVDPRAAILVNSGEIPEEVLEELAALAKELVPFETFLTAQAGCTVCSHCGPGTVGMFYAVK